MSSSAASYFKYNDMVNAVTSFQASSFDSNEIDNAQPSSSFDPNYVLSNPHASSSGPIAKLKGRICSLPTLLTLGLGLAGIGVMLLFPNTIGIAIGASLLAVAVYNLIQHIFGAKVERPPYQMPKLEMAQLFDEVRIEKMKQGWDGIGTEKWREIVDGNSHMHGKWVFDQGLHGGSVERGFIKSMEENAFPFIEEHLGTRSTTEFYLKLHEAACWHFAGKANGTLIDHHRIGEFCNSNDHLCCLYQDKTNTSLTTADWNAFKTSFEANNLGTVVREESPNPGYRITYAKKSTAKIEKSIADSLDQFYVEIAEASARRDKIRAIARLEKAIIHLHPTYDGSGRTTTLLMQKHLTEYIGHPAIFEDPNLSTPMELERFVDIIEESLKKWEELKACKDLGK